MASYNIGFDCNSEQEAEKLHAFIVSLDLYQDGLDLYGDRVSLVSKHGLITEVSKFCSDEGMEVEAEIWSEELDYDEAESEGDMESLSLPLDPGDPHLIGR